MKLWKKIFLLCSMILVIVVTACLAILIHQAQEKILAITFEQAAEKQRNLATAFREMVSYYSSPEDSEAVEYSLVHYCFSQFADDSSVLTRGGTTIYSGISLQPEEYLTFDRTHEQKRFSGKIDGQQMLIVGSAEYLQYTRSSGYAVYVVEDITPVYEEIRALIGQFASIGAASIVVGLLLIMLLVRCSTRHLVKLQNAASHIAAGNYEERVHCSTKDEVGAFAVSFNCMAESVEQRIAELTETARRQKLFIGGVTHEFKTPLTTILLNADTLQNTYMEEEERMEALARIEGQCKWLERLVQKLLLLISLNEELKLESCPVQELLRSVEESTADALAERGVTLEVNCLSNTINMDMDLMRSVVINLVDNAGKASAPGQSITVTVRENVIEVSDQGTGIPREEMERIKEPFYMVDRSRSKKQGDVGLGLALVDSIVKAHHGRMEIESTPGEGTVVRVCLGTE